MRFGLVRTRLTVASSLDSLHTTYLETICVLSDVAQIWVVTCIHLGTDGLLIVMLTLLSVDTLSVQFGGWQNKMFLGINERICFDEGTGNEADWDCLYCSLLSRQRSSSRWWNIDFSIREDSLPLNKYIYPLLDEAIHAADGALFSCKRWGTISELCLWAIKSVLFFMLEASWFPCTHLRHNLFVFVLTLSQHSKVTEKLKTLLQLKQWEVRKLSNNVCWESQFLMKD